MAKAQFKTYNQGAGDLFPCRLDDRIPQDAAVRLVNRVVDGLDISWLINTYKGGGTTSYHPRMLLKVLFYGYMNNVYSCRKIARCLEENIHYMWLSGDQRPDFRTINNFRSCRLKEIVHKLFTQVVTILVEMGQISLQTVYIDGTKIESKSNRYTFVWRKTVEKNKSRLQQKIRCILEQIEEGIQSDNTEESDIPEAINPEELRSRLAVVNRENKESMSKEQQKQLKTLEKQCLPKLEEYERHLQTLGNRNSYSKTDHDATFMRMKEDHMGNGQLKPAYNLQIGTENQFITHYDIYPNPNDTRTLKPFMSGWKDAYGAMPEELCADAGYGSEENYDYMEDKKITAFVKYNYFHKEQKKALKENPFLVQNLRYNRKHDYYVCPMGQHMTYLDKEIRTGETGYEHKIVRYQACNCSRCPLRGECFKGKGNRVIEINHNLNRHKELARERLTSPEGLDHRSRRPVEPEAVFGQMKSNMNYHRFRHTGKDKVKMDVGIFAIGFNLGKLARRLAKSAKSVDSNPLNPQQSCFVSRLRSCENTNLIFLTPSTTQNDYRIAA
jgi:transposase